MVDTAFALRCLQCLRPFALWEEIGGKLVAVIRQQNIQHCLESMGVRNAARVIQQSLRIKELLITPRHRCLLEYVAQCLHSAGMSLSAVQWQSLILQLATYREQHRITYPPRPSIIVDLVSDDESTSQQSGQLVEFDDSQQSNASSSRQVRLLDERAYCDMTHDDLVKLLITRDHLVQTYRQKLNLSTKTLTRCNKALDNASQDLTPVKDVNSNFQVQRRGVKRLSPKGVLALAIRRQFANSAAKTFGLVLLDDISGQTLCRAELELAASWIASMQHFHRSFCVLREDQNPAASDGGPMDSMLVHAYKSDATNSAVWHQSKLHVLELETTMQYFEHDDYHPSEVDSVKTIADLQRVGGGTGVPCSHS
jgi:hypothetical protein